LIVVAVLLNAEVNGAALSVEKATEGTPDLLTFGRNLVLFGLEGETVEFVLNSETFGLFNGLIYIEEGAAADGSYGGHGYDGTLVDE
jgi:hypothetical protein